MISMDNNTQKQIKSGRVSKTQRRRLLDLMKEQWHVGKGQFLTSDAKKEHNAVWEAASMELNAMGGSLKKADHWKKCWIDWKSSVKQLFGRHRAFKNRTGNLPASEGLKAIEEMDKEVLEFFSKDVVDGDGHTVELGLEAVTASTVIEVNPDIVYVDESQLDDSQLDDSQLEYSILQVEDVTENPQKKISREPSSQSCLEEVKKVCAANQAEIMNAFNTVNELVKTQNETLVQILHCLQNKN